MEAAVCRGLENFNGTDGLYGLPERTFNELREDGEIRGMFMQSTGVAKTAEQWGTMALTATATAKDITYRAAWPVRSWGDALLDFWDDFANDGRLEGRDGGQDPDARAMASRGTVLALTGFQCSGMERSIAFAARPGVHFWSNGAAWGGVCRQNAEEDTAAVELEVLSGSLELARFTLHGVGGIALDEPAAIAERETLSLSFAS